MEKQGETATLERYQAIKRMLARRSEMKLDTARHSESWRQERDSAAQQQQGKFSASTLSVKSSTPRSPGSTGSLGAGQLVKSPVVERILQGTGQKRELDLSGETSFVTDTATDKALADEVTPCTNQQPSFATSLSDIRPFAFYALSRASGSGCACIRSRSCSHCPDATCHRAGGAYSSTAADADNSPANRQRREGRAAGGWTSVRAASASGMEAGNLALDGRDLLSQ